MERDKIIEYLRNECVNLKDAKAMLEQFNDRNNNFAVEFLVHLKNNELEQVEQILDNERQFRTAITDIIVELDVRDQLVCQLSRYITIWNLYNKILEIEAEKQKINENIQTIVIRFPAAKRILGYLYDSPRENCENISKAVCYNQNIVADILDLLCDKDIIYKISIGNNAVYDLTEHGRIWVKKNIDSYETDTLYMTKILHADMQQKYELRYNNHIKYVLGIQDTEEKFVLHDKLQNMLSGGKGIEKVERKEMAGLFDYAVKYR